MAVENSSYINELNENWPDGLDPRSQGDDHLRNIKKALKNTFPNVTGAVTMTQSQLNQLGTPGVVNFPGMIVMWSGTVVNIPAGWKLCNGQGTISNGTPVPNLMDRFIVGAGNTYPVTTTGGSNSSTPVVTVTPTSLTVAQLPPHDHTVWYNRWTPNGADFGVGEETEPLGPVNPDGWGAFHQRKTSLVGSGEAHTHAVTVQPVTTIPLYYALLYIIKD